MNPELERIQNFFVALSEPIFSTWRRCFFQLGVIRFSLHRGFTIQIYMEFDNAKVDLHSKLKKNKAIKLKKYSPQVEKISPPRNRKNLVYFMFQNQDIIQFRRSSWF